MKQKLFILTLILSGLIKAQSFYNHHISLIDPDLVKEKFNEAAYTKYLLKKYTGTFEDYKTLCNYVDFVVEDAKQTYYSNYEYRGWEEAEIFLLNILKKAAPTNIIDSSIKIRVVRDADVNAYCREDGTIFVTIGFLANFNSEAELAAVLCHELGHYLSFHSCKTFEKRIKTQNTSIVMRRIGLPGSIIPSRTYLKNSQKFEEEADDYVVKFFSQNSYSIKGPVDAFNFLLKTEELQKSNVNFTMPLFYLSTHPPTSSRVKKMQTAEQVAQNSSRSDFLVDESFFKKLKTKAIDESIYILFNNGQYRACLQNSFVNHIKYSDDQFYLFYTLECLRRISIYSPGSRDDYFITGSYNVPSSDIELVLGYINTTIKNPKPKKTVFYNLQFLYPGINTEALNGKLVHRDTLEFVTEQDALAYFQREAEAKCPECFLSLQLLSSAYTASCQGIIRESDPLLEEMCSAMEATDSLDVRCSKFMKVPVFFNDIFTENSDEEFNQIGFVSTIEMRDDFNKFCRSQKVKGAITWRNKLNNLERTRLFSQMDQLKTFCNNRINIKPSKISATLFPNERYYDAVSLNSISLMPELATFVTKHKYKKILFFDLYYYRNVKMSPEGLMETDYYQGIVYCIDYAKNTISCGKSKVASSSSELSISYLMEVLEPVFQEFIRR